MKIILMIFFVVLVSQLAFAVSSDCHEWSSLGNPGVTLPVQISDGDLAANVRLYQIIPLNEKVDDFLRQVQVAFKSGRPFPTVVCVKGTIGGEIKTGPNITNQQYFIYDIQIDKLRSKLKTFPSTKK